jgi:outer membrane protein assembly factor BamB
MTHDHPTARPPARVRRFIPWLLAGLALVAGCGEKKDGAAARAAGSNGSGGWRTREWPMTRGGVALQGRVHDRVPRQPAVAWTFAAKGAVTSEAVVANGLIVFGTDEGAVIAVEMSTGKERWRAETKDAVEATPAIAAGRVFAGSNDSVFRALDLLTGKLLWQIEGEEKFPTGAVVVAGSNGTEDRLLVNGYDGVARCVRAADGSEVWKHGTQNYINGSPAILDDGLVAFGGCDSLIHLIRLKDGGAVSEITTDAQIIRSLATWGNSVYGVNYANQLIAADVSSHKIVWSYEEDDAQFLTIPAVDEARVYVGSRDKHLHAVDRLTGKRVWKFKTGGRVESSPLVFDDAVVFGSADGRLYAADPQDGHEIWRLDLGENLAVAPAFADGRIVIGGADGTLFVIAGGEGK